jgi:hypothetical protein
MRKPDVIIPSDHPNPPEPHEVEVAWILARHFNTVTEFLIPVEGYGVKTPDIVLLGLIWEIKSPEGNSKKHTIKGQFKKAKNKKRHMIIDGRRTKLKDSFIIDKIVFELETHRSVKKLLFVTKTEEVLVIK